MVILCFFLFIYLVVVELLEIEIGEFYDYREGGYIDNFVYCFGFVMWNDYVKNDEGDVECN